MIGAILAITLLLVLPQLAGLLVTRLVRGATWVAWPAAAIAVYGAVFYATLWAPASAHAQHEQMRCGTWQFALGVGLLFGLVLHLATGAVFGKLARRIRDRRAAGRDGAIGLILPRAGR